MAKMRERERERERERMGDKGGFFNLKFMIFMKLSS